MARPPAAGVACPLTGAGRDRPMEHTGGGDAPLGPVDPLVVPRFAGPATFARLPRLDQVDRCDVAVVGVPFDGGTTYRPGARFGPAAIRAGSRLLRGYHAGSGGATVRATSRWPTPATSPARRSRSTRRSRRSRRAPGCSWPTPRSSSCSAATTPIALPVLRAVHERHGPVALIHFDAHLDTWDTYFGAPYTHGTPFRRAHEEGLLASDRCVHLGIRGPLFTPEDLVDDAGFGFTIVGAFDYLRRPVDVDRRRGARTGGRPTGLRVDRRRRDGPGARAGHGYTRGRWADQPRAARHAPRSFAGLRIVGADVVEVAPAYDHAEITAIAAANVVYELLGLTARGPR